MDSNLAMLENICGRSWYCKFGSQLGAVFGNGRLHTCVVMQLVCPGESVDGMREGEVGWDL